MTQGIKGGPEECAYCRSPNFIHERTMGNSHIAGNSRKVSINKTFFCKECNKYFFSHDEITVAIGSEKTCVHAKLEKSYNSFFYPGVQMLLSDIGIIVSFCIECGAYLLTCNTIKSDLEETWSNFWDYVCYKPLLFYLLPCNYCSGENFEDTSQEISHANAKALVLLKEENDDLFKFFYNNDGFGIVQLGKELSIKTDVNRRREVYKAINDKRKEFNQFIRKARNYYRERFNLPKIGEGWVSETKLFELVKNYFKDYKVYFHYRQSWLNGLELDIFVPDKKLAVEYMGKQHYEPIKFFGGTDSHIAAVKKDKIKKELCEKNGIELIYFDYQTDVTKDNLRIALETISE